ncbi:dynein regulatory complex subunit 5-like [Coregonus clupeaformis]|uniref:dynein regulatory complex subunit 5-like n=1 Tax=Coregonus clupeaformis TaxID=59861 RepID=UPI001E1C528D|nr:dynein regulatory complex subunit 5-like [Coregonus clupeaformis]
MYPPVAADPRNMHRIIAKDPEWSLAVMPVLSNLCLQHIVRNFEEKPILPSHKDYVLERLSSSLPLQSRHLENIIELFILDVTDPKMVLGMVPLCRNYVKRLDVSQLLPPIKELQKSEEDDSPDSASDMGMDGPSMDHFDFGILLDKLSHLEELHVVYRVKGCCTKFERNL